MRVRFDTSGTELRPCTPWVTVHRPALERMLRDCRGRAVTLRMYPIESGEVVLEGISDAGEVYALGARPPGPSSTGTSPLVRR